MAYTRQWWDNGPESGTPINATRLNYLEDGVQAAASVADNAHGIASASPTTEQVQTIGSDLNELWTRQNGGPTRTAPPIARIVWTSNEITDLGVGGPWPAGGGWANDPSTGLASDAMYVDNGGYKELRAPIAGWYRCECRLVSYSNGAGGAILRLHRDGYGDADIIGVDSINPSAANQLHVCKINELAYFNANQKLTQSMQIGGSTLRVYRSLIYPNATSYFSLQWVRP